MAAKTGVLSVVTAPLYPSMDFYPTSPLQSFPPPMPARQSLRSRCGVTMRLQLSTHGLTGPMAGWSPKGHVQPHRHNLPRRRNPKRVVVVDRDHDEPDIKEIKVVQAKVTPPAKAVNAEAGSSKPKSVQGFLTSKPSVVASHPPIESPYLPAIDAVDSHLQCLIPNVFMAYSNADTEFEQLPGYSSTEPYTHVVHIGFSEEGSHATNRVTEGNTQHLHLKLPAPTTTIESSRVGLGLTDGQLRAARDFMGEALPLLDNANGVRILVTAPRGRSTDVVCVTACYFAFISGKSIEDVLLFIDAEEDFSSTWKGEVSEDEAEKVEKVARAWSWLSNIIRPVHSS